MLGDEGLQDRDLRPARIAGRARRHAWARQQNHRGDGGTVQRFWPVQQVGAQGRPVVHVRGKVSPVTQVTAATHHGQVHAGTTTGHLHRQHVHILVGRAQAVDLHGLLVQHARQRTNAVTQGRRLLELQRFCVDHHA